MYNNKNKYSEKFTIQTVSTNELYIDLFNFKMLNLYEHLFFSNQNILNIYRHALLNGIK